MCVVSESTCYLTLPGHGLCKVDVVCVNRKWHEGQCYVDIWFHSHTYIYKYVCVCVCVQTNIKAEHIMNPQKSKLLCFNPCITTKPNVVLCGKIVEVVDDDI